MAKTKEKKRKESRVSEIPLFRASSIINFMYERMLLTSCPSGAALLLLQNSSGVCPMAWMKPNSCMLPGDSVPSKS